MYCKGKKKICKNGVQDKKTSKYTIIIRKETKFANNQITLIYPHYIYADDKEKLYV